MKRATYTAAAAAALTLAGLAGLGCDRDASTASNTSSTDSARTTTAPAVDVDVDVNKSKMRDMADRTGDAIHRGAEKTGDALANAADKTKEVAKDVGGKINDAAHRTGDAANRAVDRASDRTGDAAGRASDRAANATDDAQEAASRGTAAPNGTAAAPDAEGIRDVLAQVTEAALTKGALKDMAERFVDADRNRLGQGGALKADHPDLDGRIDQFRKDWKAKYNEEFDIKNGEAALPNATFSIVQGEAGRDAATGTTGADSPAAPAADTNRNDPGRNIATVRVAGQAGQAMSVPMVHEAPDRWKIDVPDTLTADKLRQNVLDHLTAADKPDQWPADVNQAYAQVSQHILMAVMDQPAR
jgi:ankyrin